jgi:elongation factor G
MDAFLYYTNQIEEVGSVEKGTCKSDYDFEEKARKHSLYSTLIPIEYNNNKINFIDTPGYLDFEGEFRISTAVADNALIVVDAKEEIQVGTEKSYYLARKEKLPTIFFINKIDDENASFEKIYGELREKFGNNVIPFECPIIEDNNVVGSVNILRNKAWYYNDSENAKEVPDNLKDQVAEYYDHIAEAIAMCDDALMERYFSGEKYTADELARGLKLAVRAGEITPTYCGSATNHTGIRRIIDLISEYFPSYAEKGVIEAKNEKGEIFLLETNENEDLSLFVFKTVIDPFVGKITYFKVMSGKLTSDQVLYNVKKEKEEKIGQIYVINANQQKAVGKLFTGDIGATVKLTLAQTNDTLTNGNRYIIYDDIEFPKPMLAYALWPKTKKDEDKMSFAIAKILEEDRSVKFVKNRETKEQVLYCMGAQHIEVVLNKLRVKYKVEVDKTSPKIQYRETITKVVKAEGKHKKQSGGSGQYGHVKIRFEPCDSEEMVFEQEVFGGAVPRQYFPATEAGLRESMEKGVLAGYKVVGVKAVLYDGSYHDVDSKEIAFKAAAHLAYKDGMPKSGPVILEPIGKVEVIVPEEFTGTIIGDINKHRGLIMGMEMADDKSQKILADVPMAELQTYSIDLRSLTKGKGQFEMEFDRYEKAPIEVQEKVIAEALK